LEKYHKSKMENLEAVESIRLVQPQKTGQGSVNQANEGSFSEQLITKIFDNIQINFQNVHLRYEDIESWTEHPYAVGIRHKELYAVSTDAEWKVQFIQDSSAVVRAFPMDAAIFVTYGLTMRFLG